MFSGWTFTFLIAMVVAAYLGFAPVVGEPIAHVARILFWIFFVLFLYSFVAHLLRDKRR